MCGNGGRCIARFAVEKGIASSVHNFEAVGHVYAASVQRTTIRLKMKDIQGLQLHRILRLEDDPFTYHFVDTGSPHAVLTVSRNFMDEVPVEELGRAMRHHRAFSPSGTNVNFLAKASKNTIRMRTYERGVEAETLACGTGAVACCIVAAELWKMRTPITVMTTSDKKLSVAFAKHESGYSNVYLSGPADVVFEGEVRG
jgi:diaminopimelate epimerase